MAERKKPSPPCVFYDEALDICALHSTDEIATPCCEGPCCEGCFDELIADKEGAYER